MAAADPDGIPDSAGYVSGGRAALLFAFPGAKRLPETTAESIESRSPESGFAAGRHRASGRRPASVDR
jgi:hypothetical protein